MSEGATMRVLRQYEYYCPDCHKGRSKIDPGGNTCFDVMPCPTCRPDDYADFLKERDPDQSDS